MKINKSINVKSCDKHDGRYNNYYNVYTNIVTSERYKHKADVQGKPKTDTAIQYYEKEFCKKCIQKQRKDFPMQISKLKLRQPKFSPRKLIQFPEAIERDSLRECLRPKSQKSKSFHQVKPWSKQVYRCHQSRSITDTTIRAGSVKALRRRKVIKVYLPEKDDRGVGSAAIFDLNKRRKKTFPLKHSSKCVGDSKPQVIKTEMNESEKKPHFELISAVTSPIKFTSERKIDQIKTANLRNANTSAIYNDEKYREKDKCMKSVDLETMTSPLIFPDKKEKSVAARKSSIKVTKNKSTNVTERSDIRQVNVDEKKGESNVALKLKEEICKTFKEQPTSSPKCPKNAKFKENYLQSNYLMQIINYREKPLKMADSKETKFENFRTDLVYTGTVKTEKPEFKQRFEALRKAKNKEEENLKKDRKTDHDIFIKNNNKKEASLAPTSTTPIQVQSKSKVEAKYKQSKHFMSNTSSSDSGNKDHNLSESNTDIDFQIKSSPQKEERNETEQKHFTKGKFKLWERMLSPNPDSRKTPSPTTNIEAKKQSKTNICEESSSLATTVKKGCGSFLRRLFLQKKNAEKQKTKPEQASNDLTTQRCEVNNGFSFRIEPKLEPKLEYLEKSVCLERKTDNGEQKNQEDWKENVNVPAEPDKVWLDKFITDIKDTQEDVHIRWNNGSFDKNSNSTFTEIIHNVSSYADESDSTFKSSDVTSKRGIPKDDGVVVLFFQNIHAYMVQTRTKTNYNNENINITGRTEEKNTKVNKCTQHWPKKQMRQFELVLHSKNFLKLENTCSSSKFLKVAPKSFSSGSQSVIVSSGAGPENTSDEEVYQIVEYDDTTYTNSLKSKREKKSEDNILSLKDKVNKSQSFLGAVVNRLQHKKSTEFMPKAFDVELISQRPRRDSGKYGGKNSQVYDGDYNNGYDSTEARECRIVESYLRECYRNSLDCHVYSYSLNDSNVKFTASMATVRQFMHPRRKGQSWPNLNEDTGNENVLISSVCTEDNMTSGKNRSLSWCLNDKSDDFDCSPYDSNVVVNLERGIGDSKMFPELDTKSVDALNSYKMVGTDGSFAFKTHCSCHDEKNSCINVGYSMHEYPGQENKKKGKDETAFSNFQPCDRISPDTDEQSDEKPKKKGGTKGGNTNECECKKPSANSSGCSCAHDKGYEKERNKESKNCYCGADKKNKGKKPKPEPCCLTSADCECYNSLVDEGSDNKNRNAKESDRICKCSKGKKDRDICNCKQKKTKQSKQPARICKCDSSEEIKEHEDGEKKKDEHENSSSSSSESQKISPWICGKLDDDAIDRASIKSLESTSDSRIMPCGCICKKKYQSREKNIGPQKSSSHDFGEDQNKKEQGLSHLKDDCVCTDLKFDCDSKKKLIKTFKKCKCQSGKNKSSNRGKRQICRLTSAECQCTSSLMKTQKTKKKKKKKTKDQHELKTCSCAKKRSKEKKKKKPPRAKKSQNICNCDSNRKNTPDNSRVCENRKEKTNKRSCKCDTEDEEYKPKSKKRPEVVCMKSLISEIAVIKKLSHNFNSQEETNKGTNTKTTIPENVTQEMCTIVKNNINLNQSQNTKNIQNSNRCTQPPLTWTQSKINDFQVKAEEKRKKRFFQQSEFNKPEFTLLHYTVDKEQEENKKETTLKRKKLCDCRCKCQSAVWREIVKNLVPPQCTCTKIMNNNDQSSLSQTHKNEYSTINHYLHENKEHKIKDGKFYPFPKYNQFEHTVETVSVATSDKNEQSCGCSEKSKGDKTGTDSKGDKTGKDSKGDKTRTDSKGDKTRTDSKGNKTRTDSKGIKTGTDSTGDKTGTDSKSKKTDTDSKGDKTGTDSTASNELSDKGSQYDKTEKCRNMSASDSEYHIDCVSLNPDKDNKASSKKKNPKKSQTENTEKEKQADKKKDKTKQSQEDKTKQSQEDNTKQSQEHKTRKNKEDQRKDGTLKNKKSEDSCSRELEACESLLRRLIKEKEKRQKEKQAAKEQKKTKDEDSTSSSESSAKDKKDKPKKTETTEKRKTVNQKDETQKKETSEKKQTKDDQKNKDKKDVSGCGCQSSEKKQTKEKQTKQDNKKTKDLDSSSSSESSKQLSSSDSQDSLKQENKEKTNTKNEKSKKTEADTTQKRKTVTDKKDKPKKTEATEKRKTVNQKDETQKKETSEKKQTKDDQKNKDKKDVSGCGCQSSEQKQTKEKQDNKKTKDLDSSSSSESSKQLSSSDSQDSLKQENKEKTNTKNEKSKKTEAEVTQKRKTVTDKKENQKEEIQKNKKNDDSQSSEKKQSKEKHEVKEQKKTKEDQQNEDKKDKSSCGCQSSDTKVMKEQPIKQEQKKTKEGENSSSSKSTRKTKAFDSDGKQKQEKRETKTDMTKQKPKKSQTEEVQKGKTETDKKDDKQKSETEKKKKDEDKKEGQQKLEADKKTKDEDSCTKELRACESLIKKLKKEIEKHEVKEQGKIKDTKDSSRSQSNKRLTAPDNQSKQKQDKKESKTDNKPKPKKTQTGETTQKKNKISDADCVKELHECESKVKKLMKERQKELEGDDAKLKKDCDCSSLTGRECKCKSTSGDSPSKDKMDKSKDKSGKSKGKSDKYKEASDDEEGKDGKRKGKDKDASKHAGGDKDASKHTGGDKDASKHTGGDKDGSKQKADSGIDIASKFKQDCMKVCDKNTEKECIELSKNFKVLDREDLVDIFKESICRSREKLTSLFKSKCPKPKKEKCPSPLFRSKTQLKTNSNKSLKTSLKTSRERSPRSITIDESIQGYKTQFDVTTDVMPIKIQRSGNRSEVCVKLKWGRDGDTKNETGDCKCQPCVHDNSGDNINKGNELCYCKSDTDVFEDNYNDCDVPKSCEDLQEKESDVCFSPEEPDEKSKKAKKKKEDKDKKDKKEKPKNKSKGKTKAEQKPSSCSCPENSPKQDEDINICCCPESDEKVNKGSKEKSKKESKGKSNKENKNEARICCCEENSPKAEKKEPKEKDKKGSKGKTKNEDENKQVGDCCCPENPRNESDKKQKKEPNDKSKKEPKGKNKNEDGDKPISGCCCPENPRNESDKKQKKEPKEKSKKEPKGKNKKEEEDKQISDCCCPENLQIDESQSKEQISGCCCPENPRNESDKKQKKEPKDKSKKDPKGKNKKDDGDNKQISDCCCPENPRKESDKKKKKEPKDKSKKEPKGKNKKEDTDKQIRDCCCPENLQIDEKQSKEQISDCCCPPKESDKKQKKEPKDKSKKEPKEKNKNEEGDKQISSCCCPENDQNESDKKQSKKESKDQKEKSKKESKGKTKKEDRGCCCPDESPKADRKESKDQKEKSKKESKGKTKKEDRGCCCPDDSPKADRKESKERNKKESQEDKQTSGCCCPDDSVKGSDRKESKNTKEKSKKESTVKSAGCCCPDSDTKIERKSSTDRKDSKSQSKGKSKKESVGKASKDCICEDDYDYEEEPSDDFCEDKKKRKDSDKNRKESKGTKKNGKADDCDNSDDDGNDDDDIDISDVCLDDDDMDDDDLDDLDDSSEGQMKGLKAIVADIKKSLSNRCAPKPKCPPPKPKCPRQLHYNMYDAKQSKHSNVGRKSTVQNKKIVYHSKNERIKTHTSTSSHSDKNNNEHDETSNETKAEITNENCYIERRNVKDAKQESESEIQHSVGKTVYEIFSGMEQKKQEEIDVPKIHVKDSVEVLKKRKVYAESKSNWYSIRDSYGDYKGFKKQIKFVPLPTCPSKHDPVGSCEPSSSIIKNKGETPSSKCLSNPNILIMENSNSNKSSVLAHDKTFTDQSSLGSKNFRKRSSQKEKNSSREISSVSFRKRSIKSLKTKSSIGKRPSHNRTSKENMTELQKKISKEQEQNNRLLTFNKAQITSPEERSPTASHISSSYYCKIISKRKESDIPNESPLKLSADVLQENPSLTPKPSIETKKDAKKHQKIKKDKKLKHYIEMTGKLLQSSTDSSAVTTNSSLRNSRISIEIISKNQSKGKTSLKLSPKCIPRKISNLPKHPSIQEENITLSTAPDTCEPQSQTLFKGLNKIQQDSNDVMTTQNSLLQQIGSQNSHPVSVTLNNSSPKRALSLKSSEISPLSSKEVKPDQRKRSITKLKEISENTDTDSQNDMVSKQTSSLKRSDSKESQHSKVYRVSISQNLTQKSSTSSTSSSMEEKSSEKVKAISEYVELGFETSLKDQKCSVQQNKDDKNEKVYHSLMKAPTQSRRAVELSNKNKIQEINSAISTKIKNHEMKKSRENITSNQTKKNSANIKKTFLPTERISSVEQRRVLTEQGMTYDPEKSYPLFSLPMQLEEEIQTIPYTTMDSNVSVIKIETTGKIEDYVQSSDKVGEFPLKFPQKKQTNEVIQTIPLKSRATCFCPDPPGYKRPHLTTHEVRTYEEDDEGGIDYVCPRGMIDDEGYCQSGLKRRRKPYCPKLIECSNPPLNKEMIVRINSREAIKMVFKKRRGRIKVGYPQHYTLRDDLGRTIAERRDYRVDGVEYDDDDDDEDDDTVVQQVSKVSGKKRKSTVKDLMKFIKKQDGNNEGIEKGKKKNKKVVEINILFDAPSRENVPEETQANEERKSNDLSQTDVFVLNDLDQNSTPSKSKLKKNNNFSIRIVVNDSKKQISISPKLPMLNQKNSSVAEKDAFSTNIAANYHTFSKCSSKNGRKVEFQKIYTDFNKTKTKQQTQNKRDSKECKKSKCFKTVLKEVIKCDDHNLSILDDSYTVKNTVTHTDNVEKKTDKEFHDKKTNPDEKNGAEKELKFNTKSNAYKSYDSVNHYFINKTLSSNSNMKRDIDKSTMSYSNESSDWSYMKMAADPFETFKGFLKANIKDEAVTADFPTTDSDSRTNVCTQCSKSVLPDQKAYQNIITANHIQNLPANFQPINRFASPPRNFKIPKKVDVKHKVYVKDKVSHLKKRSRNRTCKCRHCLDISSEDRIIIFDRTFSELSLESKFLQEVQNLELNMQPKRLKENVKSSDALQSDEVKRAVLEIYASAMNTNGRHLVARLPKFVYNGARDLGVQTLPSRGT